MIAFTKSIAREYGKKNITINAVAPGFIQTDMIETLPNEYLDNIINSIPMVRLGKVEDVSTCGNVSCIRSSKLHYGSSDKH